MALTREDKALSPFNEHIAALRSILSDEGVQVGADAAAYEEGARFDRGVAAFVLRPTSTAEVSAAVSYCVRNEIPIVPQAGNTGVVSGSTPDASGTQAVLSLDRLSRNLRLDIDNRSVRADAGILLSDLNAALEPDGLFFPIDLGANPRLGGMLSTNAGGARFLRYGDVRRNVLGITVVLADPEGSIVTLGSSLRKNNTGVDWKQLFIGTSGAFGIITECVLNAERLPRQNAAALLVPSAPSAILPLLREIEGRAGEYLSTFEAMSGNAIRMTLQSIPRLKNPFVGGQVPNYVLLVELTRTWEPRDGEQSLDKVLETALAEIWDTQPDLLADALFGPSQQLWMLRHSIPEGLKQSGRLVSCDLAFQRGDVMKFCDTVTTELPIRFPGVIMCDFGHVGDGGVHLSLVAPHGSEAALDPDLEGNLRSWIYDKAVNDFGGSYSGEHGIGRKNQAYYDKFTPERLKGWARAMKAITSPSELGVPRLG
ncbi:FAD-binding oxidoreductase (plasmid) [Ochrobactrum sp. MT180101]|nr:FAD-binding oxidoreductase [Ochrobactrum sp. MT180101]